MDKLVEQTETEPLGKYSTVYALTEIYVLLFSCISSVMKLTIEITLSVYIAADQQINITTILTNRHIRYDCTKCNTRMWN